MQPVLTTEVVRRAGTTVIVVRGEIDMSNCEQVRDAIEPHIASAATIVLDLSAVGFMDSSAIRVMIQARKAVTGVGGSLVVRDPSDAVHRVLTVAGVLDLFADSNATS